MPTNNNGNSKADALAIVDALNIGGSATCKTFMDCVKALATSYTNERMGHAYTMSDQLEAIKISKTDDLCELIKTHKQRISDVCHKNPDLIEEMANQLPLWRSHHKNLVSFGPFLKWCVNLSQDDQFENELHRQKAYTSPKWDLYMVALKVVLLKSNKGTAKLEEKVKTLAKSNELFMEEIDELEKIIADNGISMNKCELCNKQMGDDDMFDGKPHTHCGNNICLGCIKKIEPTRNSTGTDMNSEILCPEAPIPFSYFKTMCPYCRSHKCLPRYNEYDELVVDTMKSLIAWSHKGKTPLKPSFVKFSNVMYKITGRSYLKVRTLT